jgi:hypothetical protein
MTPIERRNARCYFSVLIVAWLSLALVPRGVGQETIAAPAKFLLGVNLNGPACVIDGNAWQGQDSPSVACDAHAFENQLVPLKPTTDGPRQAMIRSSRWGSTIDVLLKQLPPEDCRVYLYVWEDNASETFDILVNDKTVVSGYTSGSAGQWRRLGPWRATANDGQIKISARGGAANFSGIEVWNAAGHIPNPSQGQFNRTPTSEQLAFFESKIRPLFIEHCYECHSAGSPEVAGGLLLDSASGIEKGGDNGPCMVPPHSDASLLMTAVNYHQLELQMPPAGKLDEHNIRDLEAWIRMGAPDPRTEDTLAALKAKKQLGWEKAKEFWSLQPVKQVSAPKCDSNWPLTDTDRFVWEQLQQHHLEPSQDASKEAWIRRATYDLTGLPPSPAQIDQFVNDTSHEAYAKVVDRLLASQEYGERWGRHWLDVVRYADTAGDNSDFPIPQMIKYRDWVIAALNRDMPYDQFIREQIAGDLISGGTLEEQRARLIATGYIAGARRFGSRVDDYPQHLTIEDTIDNLGRAFLASTVNCARCHDHKFDPITTDDYYALYGVFRSTRYPWPGIELDQKQRDLVPLTSKDAAEKVLQERRESQRILDDEVKRLEALLKSASSDAKEDLEKQVKEAKSKAEVHSKEPLPYDQAYAIVDSKTIEDSPIQIKGDPNKLGPVAHRHFLTMLGGQELPEDETSSGRLQLADWIADRNNPLTARVMVNRIWLYHFGRGLVATPNDFGRQGKVPSHPELLDWLARRFVDSGWSIKAMHREIMLSRVYRLDTHRTASARESDPSNEWLSSFPRRRLDAESIRDTLLQLSGQLQSGPNGPHPFPPQTEWKFTQHNPFKAVYETNRRSVYLMTQRIQRHPYLAIFDGADPSVSTPKRLTSTSPLQALYFLNDPFVHAQATGFVSRIMEASQEVEMRLQFAYREALGRFPTQEEIDASKRLLNAVEESLATSSLSVHEKQTQAWQAWVRSLFRLNEFVYLD